MICDTCKYATNEWICDRCGKKIDTRTMYMYKIHPGKKLIRWDSDWGGYKPLDICKKCENEFKEWFEEGRKHG